MDFNYNSGKNWSDLDHVSQNRASSFFSHYIKSNQTSSSPTSAIVNLPGLSLDGAELAGTTGSPLRISGTIPAAVFRNCHLKNITFVDCNLERADFSGATLEDVVFVACTLNHANYRGAHLTNTRFESKPAAVNLNNDNITSLESACFDRSVIISTKFGVRVLLSEATFNQARINDVIFTNCTAIACLFASAQFINLTCLGNSNFSRSSFSGAIFRHDSTNAIFDNCDLGSCDFSGVIIRGLSEYAPTSEIIFMNDTECPDTRFDHANLQSCKFISCSKDKTNFGNCTFVSANLSGSFIKGLNLSGSNFSSAVMGPIDSPSGKAVNVSTEFRQANLSGANLALIYANNVLFDNCKAFGARFPGAHLVNIIFSGGSFVDCDFSVSTILCCDFKDGTDFSCSQLTNVDFEKSSFINANFNSADFSHSQLDKLKGSAVGAGCSFEGAKFEEANLSWLKFFPECNANRAVFTGAVIDGTDFCGVLLNETDFTRVRTLPTEAEYQARNEMAAGKRDDYYFETDVHWRRRKEETRPRFRMARLRHARFDDAELIGVDFCGADLAGATLARAHLHDAQFCKVTEAIGAVFESAKLGQECEAPHGKLPLSPATMNGLRARDAVFQAADLTLCQLKGGNFSGASFKFACMEDCDLSAIFSDADFSGADLSKASVGYSTMDGTRMEGVRGLNICNFGRILGNDAAWGAHFNGAYIQATIPFAVFSESDRAEKARWDNFCEWLYEHKDHTARRGNWVAWKNNYDSLGLHREQSECCRQERISEQPQWWRTKVHDIECIHFLIYSVAIALLATFIGLCQSLWQQTFEVAEGPVAGVAIVLAGIMVAILAARVKVLGIIALDVLYGFGERPGKILLNALGSIIVFALANISLITMGLGSVGGDNGALDGKREFSWWSVGDHAYYSVVTFVGFGDFDAYGGCRGLAAAEALNGVVLAALFIHCLARRTSGR